jgi:hypothetical protein
LVVRLRDERELGRASAADMVGDNEKISRVGTGVEYDAFRRAARLLSLRRRSWLVGCARAKKGRKNRTITEAKSKATS